MLNSTKKLYGARGVALIVTVVFTLGAAALHAALPGLEHASNAAAELAVVSKTIAAASLSLLLVAGFLVHRELTRRGLVSETLARSNAELERRVTERSAELASLNTQLRREIGERRLAQVALRESEQRYRRSVESANDVIFESDPSGYFTYYNAQAAFDTFGYSKEDLLGRHFSEVVRPDWRARVTEFYRLQCSQRIPSTYYEFPVLSKDGSDVWVGQQVRLVMRDGKILCRYMFCRDVTERKRREQALEQSREKLRELSTALQKVHEDELARFAREIHAELGAMLTAVKCDLNWYSKSMIASNGALLERCAQS
jgi:PAS domain S-box-containing protein